MHLLFNEKVFRRIIASLFFITAVALMALGVLGIFTSNRIFEGILLTLGGLILVIIAIGVWSKRTVKELIEDWMLSWPL
jgi:Mn2+/Fe2+ NRAMP family transporter